MTEIVPKMGHTFRGVFGEKEGLFSMPYCSNICFHPSPFQHATCTSSRSGNAMTLNIALLTDAASATEILVIVLLIWAYCRENPWTGWRSWRITWGIELCCARN